MNQHTALSGVLASAAAGANGTTNGDTQDHNPNKKVHGTTTASPNADEESADGLDSCLLDDTFATVHAAQPILTVAIEKPNKKHWVTCHPTMEARRVAVIEMPEDRGSGIYVVRKDILPLVPQDEITIVSLHLATTRSGTFFLWLVKQGEDSWGASMREAVETAKGEWVRVVSKRGDGRYETKPPKNDLGKAVWPDKSFAEIFALAAKNRMIDSINHPVLKVLRGEF
jgi:hypothetical protein